METFQDSGDRELCNPENNPILIRWKSVLAERRGDPALFSPTGEVLQTFQGIENASQKALERLENVAKGEVVAFELGNSPAWPVLLLAAWRRGAVVVPLDPDLGVLQKHRLLSLTGARWILSTSELVRVESPSAAQPPEGTDFLKLTSGTTGAPRAIRFHAGQLLADAEAVCDSMGIGPGDRNYGVIAFSHSYGFSNLVTPLLCRGVPLVVAADALPRAIIDGLTASEATVFPSVPAILRNLAEYDIRLPKLRVCLSAGAPLPPETARKFYAAWGVKVHSFYGASECGGICYDAGDEVERPAGYVGTPMKGVSLEFVSGDQPSLIRVRSAAVGLGYFPEPDEALAQGVYQPADLLAEEAGGFVVRGRLSDFINVAGRKVAPAEIESVLQAAPGVREAVVLGLPAANRGEEVAAVVTGEATEEALRHFCAQALPAWQVPKRWFFWDRIPVNARGKVSRADLRSRILG